MTGEPTVILLVGVNGTGKTTTIGKLAYRLAELGKTPLMVAADTFRAAAVEQLSEWASRVRLRDRAVRLPAAIRRRSSTTASRPLARAAPRS